MPDKSDKLHESGRLIYPLINKYVIVEAVYHKADDLIFKAVPRYQSPDWQSKLSRSTSEAGYQLHYIPDGEAVLIVARNIFPPKKKIPWLNIVLFLATLASMIIFYGLVFLESDPLRNPELLWEGVIYALALMPIMLCHEFGHFIAARKHQAKVSLPYFIPAPTPFGTLGAIIKSKSPMRNRRQLFDVGASGPIAGFIPAVIILIIGFLISTVTQLPQMSSGDQTIVFGESIIIHLLGGLFAPEVPAGYTLVMNPVLFAGWVGLFVTMINLMPFGQMDGGHIIYALFKRKAQFYLALIALGLLLALGYFWKGWFLWAFLALIIIKLKHPPTLADEIDLTRNRKILGWLAILIFVLTFITVPVEIVTIP